MSCHVILTHVVIFKLFPITKQNRRNVGILDVAAIHARAQATYVFLLNFLHECMFYTVLRIIKFYLYLYNTYYIITTMSDVLCLNDYYRKTYRSVCTLQLLLSYLAAPGKLSPMSYSSWLYSISGYSLMVQHKALWRRRFAATAWGILATCRGMDGGRHRCFCTTTAGSFSFHEVWLGYLPMYTV